MSRGLRRATVSGALLSWRNPHIFRSVDNDNGEWTEGAEITVGTRPPLAPMGHDPARCALGWTTAVGTHG